MQSKTQHFKRCRQLMHLSSTSLTKTILKSEEGEMIQMAILCSTQSH